MTPELQEVDRDTWLDAWLASEPDGTLPRLVRELRAELAAAKARPKYHTPGPQEIALALGAALAASGQFATPGAALSAAWMAVPEYYTGRAEFLKLGAILAGMSPTEGETDERPTL